MKNSENKRSIFIPLSAGICVTAIAAAGGVPTAAAYAAADVKMPAAVSAVKAASHNAGANSASAAAGNTGANADAGLAAERLSMTKEEAENLPGCEVYIDTIKKEAVIRPKDGAEEGVISYSLANKKDDFTAIRRKLIFNDLDDGFPIRFEKRVYIFDSTEPSANDTLFYQMHGQSINVTDNLSIRFAKNLATFFMQNYSKNANRLQYIKGIGNWDTSGVTNMEKMFNLASQLKGKLDLSKWDISNTDKLDLMFSGVGDEDDSFVLDFSNKKFKNSADVKNMFNSFRGVLIANNWTPADPAGQENPIAKLVNDPANGSILTFWNPTLRKFTGPSRHLLITDNATLLEKAKTEKYKFYRKVKLFYKGGVAEVELPAVYDSRIDPATGETDQTKPASNDAMAVVKPQLMRALREEANRLRAQHPEISPDADPIPETEPGADASPTALFGNYYLPATSVQTIKGKMKYEADPNLDYRSTAVDSRPQDGEQKVLTGKVVNGKWDENAVSTVVTKPVRNGKTRVGNKNVTVEEIDPDTKYVPGNIPYTALMPVTVGAKGRKTTVVTYKVDPDRGLTDEIDGQSTKTVPATDTVMQVGNTKEEVQDISPKTVYEADPASVYGETAAKNGGSIGKKTIITTYRVDPKTGLTQEVQSTQEKVTTPATEIKIGVGNVKVTKKSLTFKTVYKADSTLAYGERREEGGKNGTETTSVTYKVDPQNGLTKTVDGTKTVAVAAVNKVVSIGNVQVTREGKKTITVTYEVNPDTGELGNPKTVTIMPWTELTPSSPINPPAPVPNPPSPSPNPPAPVPNPPVTPPAPVPNPPARVTPSVTPHVSGSLTAPGSAGTGNAAQSASASDSLCSAASCAKHRAKTNRLSDTGSADAKLGLAALGSALIGLIGIKAKRGKTRRSGK